MLETIDSLADGCNAISDEMERIMRRGNGTDPGSYSDFPLTLVVENAIAHCRQKADEKQIHVVFSPQWDVSLRGNPGQVELVCSSLITGSIL